MEKDLNKAKKENQMKDERIKELEDEVIQKGKEAQNKAKESQ